MIHRPLFVLTAFLAAFSMVKADPLAVGAPAPAISATAENGDTLTLADIYKKNTYTLVYFYPKAFTGGCTAQGCALRDSYEELTKKGVTVIGVSTDDVATQKKFRDEYHFPFPLIADTDGKVKDAFGNPGLKGTLAARQAYLIKDGKIVYADYKGSTSKQAEDILNFIAKNEAPPAK